MAILKYLLERPVAIFMSFLALAVAGAISLVQLPLSLMPETETPQLRIEVTIPNGSPMFIERSVLSNLRTASQGLLGIKKVSSIAASSSGQITLSYEHGTDMKSAYIEANEKVDQSLQFLPKEMERPVVRRVLQTDIPIVRLQLTSDILSLMELTDLSRNVVKRRLEQLSGVSLVEWNGGVKEVIRITPDRRALARYNIDESQLVRKIEASNTQLAQIKVNEGLYQYDLTFENLLEDSDHLKQLIIFDRKGLPISLAELAQIEKGIAKPTGSHWFDGKRGVVFAVHKRETADFNQLQREIEVVKNQLSMDNPEVQFELTQSQSELLNNSISQLGISLILGIVLSSVILLVFSSSWRSSVLMILLIPMAMLLCFAILKIFGLTLNIITLSGMILGVGVLIDNGIILIDNIRKKIESLDLMDSCLQGTIEIVPALISSAGTTLCVFIPLIFLEGVGGSLFQQQAFTFGVVLVSSLLVTFLLLPLLYLKINPSDNHENDLFGRIVKVYSKGQTSSVEKFFAIFFVLIVGLGVWSYSRIEQEPLPEIKTSDAQIHISWGRVMTLEAQERVITNWLLNLNGLSSWEGDLGNNEIFEKGIPGIEKALLYLRFANHEAREAGLQALSDWISSDFPETSMTAERAKNPYDQLLGEAQPYAAFDLRTAANRLINSEEIDGLTATGIKAGLGFQSQFGYKFTFKHDRLQALGLNFDQLIDPLKIQFGDQLITNINLVNQSIPVVIRGTQQLDKSSLEKINIPLNDSLSYPLAHFIDVEEVRTNRYVTADEAGIFQALELNDASANVNQWMKEVRSFVTERGWLVSFRGSFQQVQENLRYLITSFSVVLLLLFAILAAQFESLKKPLIILAEIPISLSGSLLFLWLFGQSLNLSSMMGIIIMLGIIVNDSILKVDSINRYLKEGSDRNTAIKEAGKDRLKPIVMTTLTTILALIPILWSSGLGSDIQVPLCVAVIGGLTIGTICSVYLVPLLYRALVSNGV